MPAADHAVTLITRTGCHLCQEAEQTLRRLRDELGYRYEELDVDADPARLQLVSHVASSRGEVCACDLNDVVGLAQPTVSHHLKVLVDAGILAREKRGVWAWYRVVPGALGALGGLLREDQP